jgi:hypothetical protein
MTRADWALVNYASRLLAPSEREAVLGDLAEAHESAWQGLLSVLGLVFRREVLLWKSWRPWLAGFGLALPSSFLLMSASMSVSWSYMRLLCPELLLQASLTRPSATVVLLGQGLVLIGWSWTGGFVVGSLSRRTLWASTLLCYSPCLFCLSRFGVQSLSPLCLFLFLIPAVWGVYQGRRISNIKFSTAIVLAMAVTLPMLPQWSTAGQHWWTPPRWSLNWLLLWPAWYLVATSWRFSKEMRRTGTA